jgi:transposase InsO family protein
MFDVRCQENGIEHRFTKVKHPWTNGQVERMNRTIKDATVKRYHYDSHQQFEAHLADFVSAYNFARRFKTLHGLTPYEFICKTWTKEPERFTLNPIQQMPRLNTDTSLSGARVARELDAVIIRRGCRPASLVSDNGTELTSTAILNWSQDAGVEWHYIAPGQADPERLHRELQRTPQGRALERGAVHLARSRQGGIGGVADRLQHSALTFSARLADTSRVRCQRHPVHATAIGRCAC